MAISLFLLVFDFANVSIGKVGLLGTELLVGEPRVLKALAWVVWLYFLIRYFQYLFAEPDLSIKTERAFASVAESAKKWQTHRTGGVREVGHYYSTLELRHTGLRWYYVPKFYDPTDGAMKESVKFEIPFLLYQWWRVRAFAIATVCTSYFTDFILPVVLAAAAPIVTVCF